MRIVTLCWIEGVGKPVVYESAMSEEDREAIEAAYLGLSVNWAERLV